MNAMIGLLVPALLGVDFGWQRKTDGTIEYLVQVDPETFADMQQGGVEIGSAVPASLRNRISDFSFRVGRNPLPNQGMLPPEAEPPKLGDVTGAKPIELTSGYQPPGSPGGSNSWASPTTANWPTPPSTLPTTSSSSTSVWPIPTPTTATSSSNSQPLSTSGFPINPNAAPPVTSGNSSFPGSSLGTMSSSGAYPTSTAPPSLSTGPRMTQPQPWNAAPREVAISARMPVEPMSPQSGASTTPNYQYQQQPTTSYQQQPTTWAQGQQPTQPGYQQPTQPVYPQNQQYASNTMPQGQQQPQNAQPPINYTSGSQNNAVKEPPSASDKSHANVPAAPAAAEWWPLTLVLVGLLTSLACNLYFGWSTYQLRERYRMLMVDRGAYS